MEKGRGAEIQEFLASITKQNMADRARYWSNPNFLLGFAVTVLVTVIFRLKKSVLVNKLQLKRVGKLSKIYSIKIP